MNRTTYQLLQGQQEIRRKGGNLLGGIMYGVGAGMGGGQTELLTPEGPTASGGTLPPVAIDKSPAGNALMGVGKGFNNRLGRFDSLASGGSAADINQKIALGDYEATRDLANKKDFFNYTNQITNADQIAKEGRDKENFLFQNAEKIKLAATEKFINTTGVTPDQRPDLYNKFVSEFADQVYNTALAGSKASEADANYKQGHLSRLGESEATLTPLKTELEAGKLQGEIGRLGSTNRALDVETSLRPTKAFADVNSSLYRPFNGPTIKLDANTGMESLISPPNEDAVAAAALLGKAAPGINVQPFNADPGPVLSNGLRLPPKTSSTSKFFNRVMGYGEEATPAFTGKVGQPAEVTPLPNSGFNQADAAPFAFPVREATPQPIQTDGTYFDWQKLEKDVGGIPFFNSIYRNWKRAYGQ